jgi:hypothetical protein
MLGKVAIKNGQSIETDNCITTIIYILSLTVTIFMYQAQLINTEILSINFHQKMSHWRIDIWSIKFLNTYIQKWQYLILMVNNCIFMGWCPSPPGLFPVEITYEHFNLCKKEKLYYCISGKFCSCSTFTISALIIEA